MQRVIRGEDLAQLMREPFRDGVEVEAGVGRDVTADIEVVILRVAGLGSVVVVWEWQDLLDEFESPANESRCGDDGSSRGRQQESNTQGHEHGQDG